MKKIIATIAATSLLTLSGCATILDGKTQKINVTTSNGQAASLNINGQTFQAPGIIEVNRSDSDLVINSTGECNGQAFIARKVNPTFFVNILSGGAFGSTTDYSTNAMWQYDDNVQVNCK